MRMDRLQLNLKMML